LAVKGLTVGDVLEYQVEEHTTKPLAPGQFWTEYTFTRDVIILDEQLEISVPQGRAVKVKSQAVQPMVSEVGGRPSTLGTTRAFSIKTTRTPSEKQFNKHGSRRGDVSHSPMC
jgi:hypothetical protein